MVQEDGEVAPRLRVLRLLVQNKPGDGHQIRPVRLCRMVHSDDARGLQFLLLRFLVFQLTEEERTQKEEYGQRERDGFPLFHRCWEAE